MLGKFFVTKEGRTKLFVRKKELFDDLKKTQSKKGEAAEVGGNQWHDNFSFEDLCRTEVMLNKRIADMSKIIATAIIVEEPYNYEILQIGHIALFELDDGEERRYEIVGYGESDLKADPQKIEYLAPIIRGLVGKEIDTTAKVSIGRNVREITLVDIEQREA